MNAGSSVKLMLVMARKKCCHIINSEWPGELNIILYSEKNRSGRLVHSVFSFFFFHFFIHFLYCFTHMCLYLCVCVCVFFHLCFRYSFLSLISEDFNVGFYCPICKDSPSVVLFDATGLAFRRSYVPRRLLDNSNSEALQTGRQTRSR